MKPLNHVGIIIDGNLSWAKEHNQDLPKTFKRAFIILKEILDEQLKIGIPVLTIYTPFSKTNEDFFVMIDSFVEFMNSLASQGFFDNNKIKVSVFGKWYDMPPRIVEPIKNLITTTKDYDKFFLNFCINYNGQEEIVDACKLLARQVKLGKIEPEAIDKSVIKENIYSSFLPPDLVIITGKKPRTQSFLLWDSAHSNLYFTSVLWPDFTKKLFLEALKSIK